MKDKFYHLIICMIVGIFASIIIAQTGSSYFSAFMGGALGAFLFGLGAECKDCLYQSLGLQYAVNFDLVADTIGGIIGGLIGACVIYLM